MTFVMGGVLTLAPGSDRIPVELFQILTQYAICRLPATTLMAESEEELNSLLMKVKEKSQKVGLKLNI